MPYDMIVPSFEKYSNAEIMWAQEEPLNNGAYGYIQPRLETAMEKTARGRQRLMIASRPPTSSVATGSKGAHKREIQNLLDAAFGGL